MFLLILITDITRVKARFGIAHSYTGNMHTHLNMLDNNQTYINMIESIQKYIQMIGICSGSITIPDRQIPLHLPECIGRIRGIRTNPDIQSLYGNSRLSGSRRNLLRIHRTCKNPVGYNMVLFLDNQTINSVITILLCPFKIAKNPLEYECCWKFKEPNGCRTKIL